MVTGVGGAKVLHVVQAPPVGAAPFPQPQQPWRKREGARHGMSDCTADGRNVVSRWHLLLHSPPSLAQVEHVPAGLSNRRTWPAGRSPAAQPVTALAPHPPPAHGKKA